MVVVPLRFRILNGPFTITRSVLAFVTKVNSAVASFSGSPLKIESKPLILERQPKLLRRGLCVVELAHELIHNLVFLERNGSDCLFCRTQTSQCNKRHRRLLQLVSFGNPSLSGKRGVFAPAEIP